MDEPTEITNPRCPAVYGRDEQCRFSFGHTGIHRGENHDWANTLCAADTPHGSCLRVSGHTGEHAWRLVTAIERDQAETLCAAGAPAQDAGEDSPDRTEDRLRALEEQIREQEGRPVRGLAELEKRMTLLEGRPIPGLTELKLRMTALEGRVRSGGSSPVDGEESAPEPAPQTEILQRVNTSEARVLSALESGFHRLSRALGEHPGPVVSGVSGSSELIREQKCPAELRFGSSGPYACVRTAGHSGQHRDSDGDDWVITGV